MKRINQPSNKEIKFDFIKLFVSNIIMKRLSFVIQFFVLRENISLE